MFDIGFAELLLIGIVALVVLGPERLPVAARTAGLWIGRIRRSVSNIQSEISEELRAEELRRDIAVSKKQLDDELAEMRQPFVPTSASQPQESATQPIESQSAVNAEADQGPEKTKDTP